MEPNYYDDGEQAGESATRSKGGTRGAEWYADQRGLTGSARAEFIEGFNNALDQPDREEERYYQEMREVENER